jgi:exonuclease VII small subunit
MPPEDRPRDDDPADKYEYELWMAEQKAVGMDDEIKRLTAYAKALEQGQVTLQQQLAAKDAELARLRGIKQRCEEQLEANRNAVEKFDYNHHLLSRMQAKNSVAELEYILNGNVEADVAAKEER